MIFALVIGTFFGFISAVPVAGPVSAVIFSRGMRGKYAQGRWIALGAGMVESIYTFLAFWSYGQFLADLKFVVEVSNGVAAVILGGLGIYFFRSKKMRKTANTSPTHEIHEEKAFLAGAGMSAINPSLIASWTIVATTVHSMKLFPFSLTNAGFFAAGVCVGIVLWFSLLLKIMEKNREKIDQKFLDRGLKIIGILLVGLALWMVYKVWAGLH